MESNRKDQIFFFGGENTDTDVALQPKNTYRMLTGFNIVSNTDNSYAIESEKGNSVVFSLLPYYTPIGWFKQGYKMIIISTSDGSGLQASRVKSCFSMVDISPSTHSGTPVHLYIHKELGFKIDYQHEGHAFFESPKIQRAYTTDDNVPPKVLNYGNPIFTTYFTSGGARPLVVGTTYMVVQGSVSPNGLAPFYGPNEVDNIFVATAPTYSGTGLVIEYVPVELLDWTPLYRPGQIRFNKWLPGGGLENGSYQVAFQLIGFDGVTTPWSFVTKPVHVASGYPGNALSFYQSYQGKSNAINSSKGLQFIIDDIDSNYKTIRVASIRCTSVFVQDQPILFYEGVITSPSMTIDYYGNENISQLSDNDIKEIFNYIKKVNSIQPVKNRMAGLNWESNPDIDYDPSTCKIKCIDYLCPTDILSDTTLDSFYSGGTWIASARMTGHNPQTNPITPAQFVIYAHVLYEVLTGPITYNGFPHAVGTYFFGVPGDINISGGTVCAVIRIRLYGSTYRYVRVDNDYMDSKGSLVDNYIRSNWRVEKYRYGLELVDLAGNPIFVRWAGDKTMISQSNTAGQIDPETGNIWGFDGSLMKFESLNGFDQTSLRHIGVQFDDLDIQGIVDALIISTGNTSLTVFDLPKYYSGFRLVRAPRDRQILCQGMITPCYMQGANDTQCATDIRVNSNDWTRQDQLYTLYSPDLNFQTSGSPTIEADDKMRIESYTAIRKETTSIGNPVEYIIDKFENIVTPPAGATPIGYIMPFDNVEKNLLVEPNADWNFQNSQVFHNWGQLDAGGGFRSSVGARTYFLATAYAEGAGDLVNGFGFWTGFNIVAPIVSVVRQKSNLYGGNSDSAKANTKYEYCGHYQPFDTAFLTYVNGNAGKADGIQVFGGDCWVSFWDFCRTMDNNVPNTRNYVSIFAVESNTNVMLRDGRHPAKDGPAYNTLTGGGIRWDTPPVIPEQWVYNSAFSADENTYFDPALPVNFIPNNKYPYQAIYSNAKLLGEFTDAFRKFDLANKRDLDGSGGAGINLRLKNDRLFYWQEFMMGYLPVEERANVPVGLNEPMIIGTGGIMPRYDTVDNFYGNFHQFGLTETENGFIWFDRNKRALCYFDASVTSLSASQGRISFFQNNLNGDILINDRPVSGSGIAGVYDSRFKKVLMVFKGSPIGDFTISYDVKSKIFLGAHPYSPGILFDLNQFLYSCFPGWYSAPGIQPNHVYTIGDKITDASVNYVCIATYTTPASPILPGSDSIHWVAVNTNNQIYLHNSNDIGKFYGIVEDEAFEIIANQEKDKTKIWNNYEFTGNDIFWNDITCETTDQTGQDVGITSGVLSQYRYMDRKWYGTIPQDAVTGRLRDVFIKILMEKQNRLNGSPVTSTNKMLKMSSITVLYNEDY